MQVGRRRLRTDELTVHVEADAIRLPVHAVGMIPARVGHLAVDLAGLLPRRSGRLRIGRVNRAVDAAVVVSVMLDDIEFLVAVGAARLRALLIRQQPEGVPGVGIVGEIGADLEVAVGLREIALRADEAGLPAPGISGRARPGRRRRDRQDTVLDAEGIVTGRGVEERGPAEADVGIGVVPPLGADVPVRGPDAVLRDAARVELVVESQAVASQINHRRRLITVLVRRTWSAVK